MHSASPHGLAFAARRGALAALSRVASVCHGHEIRLERREEAVGAGGEESSALVTCRCMFATVQGGEERMA